MSSGVETFPLAFALSGRGRLTHRGREFSTLTFAVRCHFLSDRECVFRSRQNKNPRRDRRGVKPNSLVSTSVTDRSYRKRLSRSQVLGGDLAPLAINDRLVRDFLSFVEVAHARAFDCADVNEHILRRSSDADRTRRPAES